MTHWHHHQAKALVIVSNKALRIDNKKKYEQIPAQSIHVNSTYGHEGK
jgi:hypothetical protein